VALRKGGQDISRNFLVEKSDNGIDGILHLEDFPINRKEDFLEDVMDVIRGG